MNSETYRNHNTLSPTRRQRTRRAGNWLATTGVVATTLMVGGHLLNKHNHIKSADTMAAVEAEVGHIPAGIKAIKTTRTPGVKEVQYVVQPEPDKQFVSSVAADLHPIAPNQDPLSEFSAIESYSGTDHLYTGEELDMMVDTDQGVILSSSNPSAKSNG